MFCVGGSKCFQNPTEKQRCSLDKRLNWSQVWTASVSSISFPCRPQKWQSDNSWEWPPCSNMTELDPQTLTFCTVVFTCTVFVNIVPKYTGIWNFHGLMHFIVVMKLMHLKLKRILILIILIDTFIMMLSHTLGGGRAIRTYN